MLMTRIVFVVMNNEDDEYENYNDVDVDQGLVDNYGNYNVFDKYDDVVGR